MQRPTLSALTVHDHIQQITFSFLVKDVIFVCSLLKLKSLALNAVLKIDEKTGYSILHAICINKDMYPAIRIAVQAICAGHDIQEHRVSLRLGSKSKKAERFAGMNVTDILRHLGEYAYGNLMEELLRTLRGRSSSLLKAVTTEDVDQVIRLVREGEDVNQSDARGGWERESVSPLTVACITGSHEILSTLVDLGADVGPQRERVRIHWDQDQVPSPLSVASAWNNYNAVKLLMRKGADVNGIDKDGNMALDYAAANGNVEIVKLLLDSGADTDKIVSTDNSALHLTFVPAVSSELYFPPFEARYDAISGSATLRTKRRQTSKYLIERGFQVDKKNSWGQTPLFLALSSADTETVLLLTEKKSRGKGSALGMRSDEEEQEASKRRKEAKERGREGKREMKGSPLGMRRDEAEASERRRGKKETLRRARKEYKEGKRAMSLSTDTNVQVLRHRVDMKLLDVNMTDDRERTPLHEASEAGDTEAVGLLLRLCADINAVDKDGRTALHLAISRSHPEVALNLIHGGANANIKDDTGRNSLHYAAMFGVEDVIDALLKFDLDINAVDKEGCTALHLAINMSHLVVALNLIHGGANANIKDDTGRNSLHYAAMFGVEDVIDALLKFDLDINAVDKEGCTALHYAVQRPQFPGVTMKLISAGAKVDVEDISGWTPLELAEWWDQQDIVPLESAE